MRKGGICLLLSTFIFASFYIEQVQGGALIPKFNNNSVQQSSITLKYNSVLIELSTKPISSDGCIMVPASEILSLMGMTKEYDKNKSILRMKKDSGRIILQEGNQYARINGVLTQLDKVPVKVNNDFLIPINLISQWTDATVSYEEKTNIVLINKYQYPAQETKVQDSNKAEKLSGQLDMTKDELLKLKADLGNWKDAVLKAASKHKENDLEAAIKMSDGVGFTEESLLNLKYILGEWPKVYDTIISDRQKVISGGDISIKYYEDINFRDYLGGMNFEEFGYTNKIASITNISREDILELGRKSGWKKAIEKYSENILEGASYYGMPEGIITKLQSCGFTSLEIFDHARDAYKYRADYINLYEELSNIKGINKNKVENFYKKNIWLRNPPVRNPLAEGDIGIDIIDPVIKEEFAIGAADMDSFGKSGVKNIIDIAWFKHWGIRNRLEIENIMALSKKYMIPIYKVFDVAIDYISWFDIDEALRQQSVVETK